MKDLLKEIEFNTEFLQTLDGDEHECITIENLKGILKAYNITKKKNCKNTFERIDAIAQKMIKKEK
tara:strand:- start:11471 stop:11668 length:198 start_codon:yes stop_codon:yes gene_type:complete